MPPTIGPYPQAVRAGGLVFVSGQPGIDPATGDAAGGGFGPQVRQAFRYLETALRAAGLSPLRRARRRGGAATRR
ncbi:MAG TPA: Rid family hydrolase [Actinomycetota bacterium]|jgi:2-iminobutanoate/2-iminopropanoate deaminase